jgi:hypothetical protein
MKKFGVYKYVYDNEIIYVGKSDHSIIGRIKGHSTESKFKPFLEKCQIYYAWLPNPAFTTIFEIFLINKYKPRLNVSMKYDTILPFDICEPVWHQFDSSQGLLYQEGDELNFTNSNDDELFNLSQEINKLNFKNAELLSELDKLKSQTEIRDKKALSNLKDKYTAKLMAAETQIDILNNHVENLRKDKEYWRNSYLNEKKISDRNWRWGQLSNDSTYNWINNATNWACKYNKLEKEHLITKKALSDIQAKFDDLLAKYKQAQLNIESKNNIIDSMKRKSESKRKFKSFFSFARV